MRSFNAEKLKVYVFETRAELGTAAAAAFSEEVKKLLETKEKVNIIFASAPSQNEFLAELKKLNIEWNRIIAFHMDEYVGLDGDAPQGFGTFLKDRLFNDVTCNQVHYLNGNAKDPQEECIRYSALLKKYPTDIVCLGIGENTHLAFNDPHVADFADPEMVKVVELDEQCRMQQVNDGCFTTLEEVPRQALTITIPALFVASYASAVVPGERKATAIYHTINSGISEKYPSTLLRTHNDASLYIDEKSAGEL
jgi:glucosamine-6-phosphate deaminase